MAYVNLTDYTYFVGDIVIPNTSVPAIQERVNHFINKYEKECLIKALGVELFNAFVADSTSGTPVVPPASQTRMQDITFGCPYEDFGGNPQVWDGLIDTTNKISPLSNYIYCEFEYASALQTTGVSTGVMNTNAGVSVAPSEKIERASSIMAEKFRSLAFFLWSKQDVYPEYKKFNYRNTLESFRTYNIFGI